MVRQYRPSDHQTRAKWTSGERKVGFWCKKVVENETSLQIGQPFATSTVVIETVSNLPFEIDDLIIVGSQTVSIQAIRPSTVLEGKHGHRNGKVMELRRLVCS